MLIVQGVFRLEPSDVAAFLEGWRPCMEHSRTEQGCLEYVMAPDPADAGRVVLSERWESRADLDAHLAAMSPPTGGPAMLGREVNFFEATPTTR